MQGKAGKGKSGLREMLEEIKIGECGRSCGVGVTKVEADSVRRRSCFGHFVFVVHFSFFVRAFVRCFELFSQVTHLPVPFFGTH